MSSQPSYGGRYVKLSRRLSQTPWFINGEHKMENSVQELLCKCIMDYTKSKCIKFLSSGREDVDVRMLLNGRPFAIEVINPKMTQISESDLVHLNREINKGTGIVKTINGLKVLTKNNLKQLKEGECLKSKTYRALCIFKKMVDKSFIIETLQNVRNLKIIQNTPLRVIHRRALSPRERIIYQIRARFPNSEEFNSYKKQVKFIKEDWTYLIIDLNTQAGTYVKEFIHGDFGRTMPNLCYLLKTEIDIVALDVTNIALAWP